jgi:hypothetical protein
MLYWNWKLVLATGTGVGLMLLVYWMQGWNWQVYWSKWERFLRGSNRKLTVAVGSGGLAALATYLAASIWVDSENRWLAVGTILQGLATLLTLILLVWQIITHRNGGNEAKFDQLLTDLSNPNPLKRLMAVRQLTKLTQKTPLSQDSPHQLIEYFCLMLSQEKEPVVRNAILESLQLWERKSFKNTKKLPLQIPISLKKEELL